MFPRASVQPLVRWQAARVAARSIVFPPQVTRKGMHLVTPQAPASVGMVTQMPSPTLHAAFAHRPYATVAFSRVRSFSTVSPAIPPSSHGPTAAPPRISSERANKLVENALGFFSENLYFHRITHRGEQRVLPLVLNPRESQRLSGVQALVEGIPIQTTSTPSVMQGQVQLIELDDSQFEDVKARLSQSTTQARLEEKTKALVPNLYRREGGLCSVGGHPLFTLKRLPHGMASLTFNMDVRDAMGANLLNIVAEGLAPDIRVLLGCQTGARILSNACPDRRASASIEMPLTVLADKGISQEQVLRWLAASQEPHAIIPSLVATLHPIQGLVEATGNDWRAVISAACFDSAKTGVMQPLVRWRVEEGILKGTCDAPFALGCVGRNRALETADWVLTVNGNPSSAELAEQAAMLGLLGSLSTLSHPMPRQEKPDIYTPTAGPRRSSPPLEKTREIPVVERRKRVASSMGVTPTDLDVFNPHPLDTKGITFPLPCGIVPNVLINGALHHLCYAVEEPSVGAALANGAKITGRSGGVQAELVEIQSGVAYVSVSTCITPASLTRTGYTGEQVRGGVIMVSDFAEDPFRAVTHNKGTENGSGPTLKAMGGDVVQAAVLFHCSAYDKSGVYKPVITWRKDDAGNLIGEGVLPIPLEPYEDTPQTRLVSTMMGNPDPVEKAMCAASAALLSNLTALAALGTTGINAGHLKLHRQAIGHSTC